MSNVQNINFNIWKSQLAFILANQCLAIKVGSVTVINIFPLWWHGLLPPEAPLQLIKCGYVCMRKFLGVSAKLTIYIVLICTVVEQKRTHVKNCQWTICLWLLNDCFHVDSGISLTISTSRPYSTIWPEGSKLDDSTYSTFFFLYL